MTVVKIEKDSDGELVFPLDPDMLEELGWGVGDTLQWIDNSDGTYSIIKHEDSNPK